MLDSAKDDLARELGKAAAALTTARTTAITWIRGCK